MHKWGIVGLEHYAIQCIIGDLPDERTNEQEIYIDLKVEANIAPCAASDSVKDAVDYVALGNLSSQVAQKGKFCLIETLADHILENILENFDVNWAWIKIKKPEALSLAKYATIELKRTKN